MTIHAPALAYTDPPELDHIVHLVSPGKLPEAVAQFQHLGFSVERGGIHADGLTQNALIILTDGVYIELIEFLDKPLKEHAGHGDGETLHEWKQRRAQHWWWGRRVGWIDWCLRGGVQDGRVKAINEASREIQRQRAAMLNQQADKEGPEGDTNAIATVKAAGGHDGQSRAPFSQDLVQYNAFQEGGRRALSGKEIRWNVTFPVLSPNMQRGAFPFWCEDKTPRWWRGERCSVHTFFRDLYSCNVHQFPHPHRPIPI